jgi:hypothetical protein
MWLCKVARLYAGNILIFLFRTSFNFIPSAFEVGLLFTVLLRYTGADIRDYGTVQTLHRKYIYVPRYRYRIL